MEGKGCEEDRGRAKGKLGAKARGWGHIVSSKVIKSNDSGRGY